MSRIRPVLFVLVALSMSGVFASSWGRATEIRSLIPAVDKGQFVECSRSILLISGSSIVQIGPIGTGDLRSRPILNVGPQWRIVDAKLLCTQEYAVVLVGPSHSPFGSHVTAVKLQDPSIHRTFQADFRADSIFSSDGTVWVASASVSYFVSNPGRYRSDVSEYLKKFSPLLKMREASPRLPASRVDEMIHEIVRFDPESGFGERRPFFGFYRIDTGDPLQWRVMANQGFYTYAPISGEIRSELREDVRFRTVPYNGAMMVPVMIGSRIFAVSRRSYVIRVPVDGRHPSAGDRIWEFLQGEKGWVPILEIPFSPDGFYVRDDGLLIIGAGRVAVFNPSNSEFLPIRFADENEKIFSMGVVKGFYGIATARKVDQTSGEYSGDGRFYVLDRLLRVTSSHSVDLLDAPKVVEPDSIAHDGFLFLR